jgi:hypothetical protein
VFNNPAHLAIHPKGLDTPGPQISAGTVVDPLHHVGRAHRAHPVLVWHVVQRRLQARPVERAVAVLAHHLAQSEVHERQAVNIMATERFGFSALLSEVFRISGILVRIWIRGFVPLTNGSGSWSGLLLFEGKFTSFF